MSRILVTGGCGMIGSNLVKRLVAEGHRVSVIDNLWRGKLEYLRDSSGEEAIDISRDFHLLDLTVPAVADRLIAEAEYVVHLADIVGGIGYVDKNQGRIFRDNNLINSNVFDSVRRVGAKRIKGLVYVGTACSFPRHLQQSVDGHPLKECDLFPADPESAYGWSKLMGVLEIEYLERECGIPCCTLLFHNAYGSPCDYGQRAQVIPSLIRKAVMYPEEPFVVWGSGYQGRAFVHVDDIVDALCLALEKGLGHGRIQIGPSHCTSIREVAETIVRISGKDIEIIYDRTKPEGDIGRCADFSKARRVLGWTPKVSLEKGLLLQYQWIEEEICKTRGISISDLSLTESVLTGSFFKL